MREKKQGKTKVKSKNRKVLIEWRKMQVLIGESYFRRFATSHAQAIKAFTVKSPGTTLASMDPSQWIDRKTPVPAPAATPVGPYKLSIHPRTGSWYVDITENSIKSSNQINFYVHLTDIYPYPNPLSFFALTLSRSLFYLSFSNLFLYSTLLFWLCCRSQIKFFLLSG